MQIAQLSQSMETEKYKAKHTKNKMENKKNGTSLQQHFKTM